MATVAEYPDAVRRIAESDVPGDATTRDAVVSALVGSGPQVTPEVAQDMADALLTEERVIDAIESSGEIPSAGELDAIVAVSDDYDMADRAESVGDAIRDRIATMEDFDRAIDERAGQDGPLFREQIEAGVDGVASEKEVVGGSADDVVEQEARQRGAPTERSFNQARNQAIGANDPVVPSERDDLSSNSSTPINVIRDDAGNAVAAFGGRSQGGVSPKQTAQELGVEYAGSGTEALGRIRDEIGLDQQEGQATLTFRGQRLSEVDL